ncbi:MAG: biotin attachment protein [Firmicutes bacterium]|nr:biotin attachment protein [Bacillota bacterium]
MAVEFIMPKLGHMSEEATIASWKKQVGERVSKGEILLEVETEKSTLEVESPISGVLLKILVSEGETVPIGTPIALLGDADEIVCGK